MYIATYGNPLNAIAMDQLKIASYVYIEKSGL